MHILNLSIDPTCPEQFFIPEDLTINKIESIAELLVEEVLGIPNVFKEHNESYDFNGCTIIHSKILLSKVEASHLIFDFKRLTSTRIEYFISDTEIVPLVSLEISSPPPKS
jgi:hypothetical protein